MIIKDEILEELCKGTLLVEINRRFQSQSQKHEAMREFFGKAKEIVEKMHEELEELRTGLLGTGTALEKANHEKEEVSGEIQELVQTKEKLDEEVSRKAAKLDYLNAAI
jgi:chromosome segregation ATPase